MGLPERLREFFKTTPTPDEKRHQGDIRDEVHFASKELKLLGQVKGNLLAGMATCTNFRLGAKWPSKLMLNASEDSPDKNEVLNTFLQLIDNLVKGLSHTLEQTQQIGKHAEHVAQDLMSATGNVQGGSLLKAEQEVVDECKKIQSNLKEALINAQIMQRGNARKLFQTENGVVSSTAARAASKILQDISSRIGAAILAIDNLHDFEKKVQKQLER